MEDNKLLGVSGEESACSESKARDETDKDTDANEDAKIKEEIENNTNDNESVDEKDETDKIVKNHKPFRAKSDKSIKVGMSVFLLFSVLVSALLYFVLSEKDKVANGTNVFIGDKLNESVGDLSYNQAIEKIDLLINEYLNSNLNLTDSEKNVSVKIKDLGVTINTEKAVDEIKNSLYTPYIIDSIERHYSFSKKIDIVPKVKIDMEKLKNFVNTSLKHIQKEPQDAELFVNKNGEVEIKPHVQGRTVDRAKLMDDIIAAVKEYNLNIKTPTFTLTPLLTNEKIKDMMPKKMISTFSTYYGGSDWGRKTNVELGASLINNALLKPGEEFEYWNYVGETTFERGFKLAGIYQNGRLALGIGGGLCQVSTTLYNAALLADLKITERSPHGLPVSYVPLGLDATVATGWYSLRFVNNTNNYIHIKSSSDGSTLTFSIYGDMPEGKTVKVYAYNVGSKAADSYRDVYMNGERIRHDYLGRDYYK